MPLVRIPMPSVVMGCQNPLKISKVLELSTIMLTSLTHNLLVGPDLLIVAFPAASLSWGLLSPRWVLGKHVYCSENLPEPFPAPVSETFILIRDSFCTLLCPVPPKQKWGFISLEAPAHLEHELSPPKACLFLCQMVLTDRSRRANHLFNADSPRELPSFHKPVAHRGMSLNKSIKKYHTPEQWQINHTLFPSRVEGRSQSPSLVEMNLSLHELVLGRDGLANPAANANVNVPCC